MFLYWTEVAQTLKRFITAWFTGIRFPAVSMIFLYATTPRPLQHIPEASTRVYSTWSVILTTYFHAVLRLIWTGALPPLFCSPLCMILRHSSNCSVKAVLWLRRLVAGLSSRWPGFAPWSIQWDRFFSESFGFPLSIWFHRQLHIFSEN
jgi:hypothetical protein